MKDVFAHIWKEGKELFFPLRCPVCDQVLPHGQETICLNCLKKLSFVTAPWCEKCGKKLLTESIICKDCRETEHAFARGRALFEYSSMKQSIYRYKYGGRREYARFYGEAVSRYLRDFLETVRPEALIPIPLSKKRLKTRGYNQALLLAKEIEKHTKIPVNEDFLLRQKNTAPLKLQNKLQRQNNLKKAFIIGQNDVKLKTIILIDDIYTTGSTMDEAARTLREAGVEHIYFLVLACGVGI